MIDSLRYVNGKIREYTAESLPDARVEITGLIPECSGVYIYSQDIHSEFSTGKLTGEKSGRGRPLLLIACEHPAGMIHPEVHMSPVPYGNCESGILFVSGDTENITVYPVLKHIEHMIRREVFPDPDSQAGNSACFKWIPELNGDSVGTGYILSCVSNWRIMNHLRSIRNTDKHLYITSRAEHIYGNPPQEISHLTD